jgi:hypothetical protein
LVPVGPPAPVLLPSLPPRRLLLTPHTATHGGATGKGREGGGSSSSRCQCRAARTGGRGRPSPRPSTASCAPATSRASRGSCGRTPPSSTTRTLWSVLLALPPSSRPASLSLASECAQDLCSFLAHAVWSARTGFVRKKVASFGVILI